MINHRLVQEIMTKMFDSFSYNCLAFCLPSYCQHHPHREIVVEENSAVTVSVFTCHSPAVLWHPVTVVIGGHHPSLLCEGLVNLGVLCPCTNVVLLSDQRGKQSRKI